MFNVFEFDKRLEASRRSIKLQRKLEHEKQEHNKHNEQLRESFEKRIDKIIEHRLKTPWEPAGDFVLNETFFKQKNNADYKMELAGKTFLKLTFNTSEKAQILSSIEKNKILATDFLPQKPVVFRERDPNKEIHPAMRFTSKPNPRRNRYIEEDSNIRKSTNESGLNKSLDTQDFLQKLNNDVNQAKAKYTRLSSVESKNCTRYKLPEATKEKKASLNDSACIEAYSRPIKSILTRAIDLNNISKGPKPDLIKKRSHRISIDEIDDEMLCGRNISFDESLVPSYPDRRESLQNARRILKAAKVIK